MGQAFGVKRRSAWLVYFETEKGWQRSLLSAESGRKGDLAAVYFSRPVQLIEMDFLRETHIHQFPSCRGTMHVGLDGFPRGTGAEHDMIESWTVASFIDSAKDEAGDCAARLNCKREWEQDWTRFNTDKTVANPILSNRLALILTVDVDCYVKYLYPYDWNKIEQRSEAPARKTSNAIQRQLAESGGRNSRR